MISKMIKSITTRAKHVIITFIPSKHEQYSNNINYRINSNPVYKQPKNNPCMLTPNCNPKREKIGINPKNHIKKNKTKKHTIIQELKTLPPIPLQLMLTQHQYMLIQLVFWQFLPFLYEAYVLIELVVFS